MAEPVLRHRRASWAGSGSLKVVGDRRLRVVCDALLISFSGVSAEDRAGDGDMLGKIFSLASDKLERSTSSPTRRDVTLDTYEARAS